MCNYASFVGRDSLDFCDFPSATQTFNVSALIGSVSVAATLTNFNLAATTGVSSGLFGVTAAGVSPSQSRGAWRAQPLQLAAGMCVTRATSRVL